MANKGRPSTASGVPGWSLISSERDRFSGARFCSTGCLNSPPTISAVTPPRRSGRTTLRLSEACRDQASDRVSLRQDGVK